MFSWFCSALLGKEAALLVLYRRRGLLFWGEDHIERVLYYYYYWEVIPLGF